MKIVLAYFDYPTTETANLFVGDRTDLPLGLACVRAYARKDAVVAEKTEMINRSFTHEISGEEAIAAVVADSPDMAAFALYIWNCRKTLEACRALKERAPGIRILIGGPQIPRDEKFVRDFMEENPFVDIAVRGEGEAPFTETVKALASGDGLDGVAGIAWRAPGGIQVEASRPTISDLTTLPSPYLTGDLTIRPEGRGMLTLETSRGCPYLCTFCDYYTERGVRTFFPLERLRAELEHIKRSGYTGVVYMADPALNINRNHAREVFPILQGYENFFVFDLKPELWDDALIDAFAAIPRVYASFGIQSINSEPLKNVKRPFGKWKAEYCIGRLVRCPNVEVHIDVILGLPGDDYQGFRRTLDWALGFSPIPMLTIFDLSLLPNTALESDAERFGMKINERRAVLKNYSFSEEDMLLGSRLAVAYNKTLASEGCLPVLHDAIGRSGERPTRVLDVLVEAMLREGLMPQGRVMLETLPSMAPLEAAFLKGCFELLKAGT